MSDIKNKILNSLSLVFLPIYEFIGCKILTLQKAVQAALHLLSTTNLASAVKRERRLLQQVSH